MIDRNPTVCFSDFLTRTDMVFYTHGEFSPYYHFFSSQLILLSLGLKGEIWGIKTPPSTTFRLLVQRKPYRTCCILWRRSCLSLENIWFYYTHPSSNCFVISIRSWISDISRSGSARPLVGEPFNFMLLLLFDMRLSIFWLLSTVWPNCRTVSFKETTPKVWNIMWSSSYLRRHIWGVRHTEL